MQMLLRCLSVVGADKNKQGRNGVTPLIHATKGGHFAIVKALVEAEAEKDTRYKRGMDSSLSSSTKRFFRHSNSASRERCTDRSFTK